LLTSGLVTTMVCGASALSGLGPLKSAQPLSSRLAAGSSSAAKVRVAKLRVAKLRVAKLRVAKLRAPRVCAPSVQLRL
jgi:hypothetical protein